MQLGIGHGTVRRLLIAGGAATIFAGFASEILRHGFGLDVGLVDVFSPAYDSNVVTWYISAVLLWAGFATSAIASRARQQSDRDRRHWLGLASLVFFLSLNNLARLQDRLADHPALRPLFTTYGGLLTGLVVVALLVVFARFFMRLPRGTAVGVGVAALVYGLGQAGGTWLLGLWSIDHDVEAIGYALLEMSRQGVLILGASILTATLFAHLAATAGEVRLSVRTR